MKSAKPDLPHVKYGLRLERCGSRDLVHEGTVLTRATDGKRFVYVECWNYAANIILVREEETLVTPAMFAPTQNAYASEFDCTVEKYVVL